jgi:hypothetical protein
VESPARFEARRPQAQRQTVVNVRLRRLAASASTALRSVIAYIIIIKMV